MISASVRSCFLPCLRRVAIALGAVALTAAFFGALLGRGATARERMLDPWWWLG